MAVVVNGTPAVTTFAAVASGSATMPAGVTTGELLTLDFAQAFDVGITTPSGWTPIIAAGDGFGATRGASFYRIADGSEGASLALTFGGSCDAVAIITRHGGFNSAAPINGTPQSGSGTSGSTTAITSPSVTTTVDGCLIRRVAESRQSAGIATPSGQTDGGTGTTGSGGTNSTSRATYSTQATAGATGTVTFTSAAGGDREWVSLTYAIAPSPGPTITGQPSDQTANNGATATFSVTATGATSYQWKRNGSNVGTSSNSYTTPAVAYSDQGAQYTVDCINANGTTTSVAATLRVAFNLSGTGPRAFPGIGGVIGAGTVDSWVRATATSGGGATVNGQTLTAVASVIAGSVTAAATVSGQTASSTASVIAGAVQAAATVSGQVVTAVASLIAGAVTAAATVNGQTATVNASVLAGTASGGGAVVVNGQTVTVTASVIAGSVTAAALVDAQVITVVASAIAGTVQAAATIAGQLLTSTASVIAGAVTAAADVAGQTLTVNASVLAGTASGGGAATVNGQTTTATASVIAGAVTGAAVVDGQLLTVNASVIAGGAFVPSGDATLQSKALRTGIGMGL